MMHLPEPIKQLLPMRMWPIPLWLLISAFTDAFDTPPNNFSVGYCESGLASGSLTIGGTFQ
jgi:hypothetical protein